MFNIKMKDTDIQVQSISGVRITNTFESLQDIISYQLSDERFNYGVKKNDPAMLQEVLNTLTSGTPSLPQKMLKHKNRDTSLGGNDAINCYWQFNEDDDIIHPYTSIHGKVEERKGMGRVYSETFDDKQQIMYMTFGMADFSGLLEFFSNMIDPDAAKLVNNNVGSQGIIQSLTHKIGKVTGFLFILPILPFKWIAAILGKTLRSKVTKYYDFKATMPLYYKTVNVMLTHLAVNLGLYFDKDADIDVNAPGLPNEFKFKDIDIFRIMTKKDKYDNNAIDLNTISTSEELKKVLQYEFSNKEAAKSDDGNAFYRTINGFLDGAKSSILDASNFVGFKIEKSVDNSESASNSTGEIPLLSKINGAAKSALDAKYSTSAGNIAKEGAFGAFNSFVKGFTNILSSTLESFGAGSAVEILRGSGFVDMPDVWKSSSFSKSYSFNMQLRAPGGDPLSIFYYIYVPLAMLIAGGFPRAVGRASYTSPFLIRAYCKGMFAIPLGIIESITIKRGASEFGWSFNNLPTSIDVSFSIKDLSPIMYIPVGDEAVLPDIIGQNSSYQEYLLTLSGVSIRDRILLTRKISRNIAVFLNVKKNNQLNPLAWGFGFGDSLVGRAISAMSPTSRIPN